MQFSTHSFFIDRLYACNSNYYWIYVYSYKINSKMVTYLQTSEFYRWKAALLSLLCIEKWSYNNVFKTQKTHRKSSFVEQSVFEQCRYWIQLRLTDDQYVLSRNDATFSRSSRWPKKKVNKCRRVNTHSYSSVQGDLLKANLS